VKEVVAASEALRSGFACFAVKLSCRRVSHTWRVAIGCEENKVLLVGGHIKNESKKKEKKA
jgi:hypothetical protein